MTEHGVILKVLSVNKASVAAGVEAGVRRPIMARISRARIDRSSNTQPPAVSPALP